MACEAKREDWVNIYEMRATGVRATAHRNNAHDAALEYLTGLYCNSRAFHYVHTIYMVSGTPTAPFPHTAWCDIRKLALEVEERRRKESWPKLEASI